MRQKVRTWNKPDIPLFMPSKMRKRVGGFLRHSFSKWVKHIDFVIYKSRALRLLRKLKYILYRSIIISVFVHMKIIRRVIKVLKTMGKLLPLKAVAEATLPLFDL